MAACTASSCYLPRLLGLSDPWALACAILWMPSPPSVLLLNPLSLFSFPLPTSCTCIISQVLNLSASVSRCVIGRVPDRETGRITGGRAWKVPVLSQQQASGEHHGHHPTTASSLGTALLQNHLQGWDVPSSGLLWFCHSQPAPSCAKTTFLVYNMQQTYFRTCLLAPCRHGEGFRGSEQDQGPPQTELPAGFSPGSHTTQCAVWIPPWRLAILSLDSLIKAY